MARIRMPNTFCGTGYTHLKILTDICKYRYPWGFAGDLYRPGCFADPNKLPEPCIALECAGSIGPRLARITTWILWRLDRATMQWVEIMRTTSTRTDLEWADRLRPAAIQALKGPDYQPPGLNEISARMLGIIEKELQCIDPDLRGPVLIAIQPDLESHIARCLELEDSCVHVHPFGRARAG